MSRLKTQREGLHAERVKASKQHDGSVFRNPSGLGNPLPLLGEFFFGGAQRNPPGKLPVDRPQEAWPQKVSSGLRVTWLGHSPAARD